MFTISVKVRENLLEMVGLFTEKNLDQNPFDISEIVLA